jgi:carboxymethylenebutenolidase
MTMTWRQPPADLVNRSFGETISVGRGRSSWRGYMAHSDRVGPGLLLVHDVMGLTPWIVQMADALNREGFTVLCPDLFDERLPRDGREGAAVAGSLDPSAVDARLRAAAEHLTANWHPRLGAIAFGWGAGPAVRLAQSSLDGLVLYGPAAAGGEGGVGGCPLLGHFGSEDPAAVALLETPGADAEVLVYGAGERFFDPTSPDYDEAAAHEAHEATLEFVVYHVS